MSFIQMRTVPGLFVGRRTLISAQAAPVEGAGGPTYRCGACDSAILGQTDPSELRDVVVKCGCGEINQL